jgi:hypothetical protein
VVQKQGRQVPAGGEKKIMSIAFIAFIERLKTCVTLAAWCADGLLSRVAPGGGYNRCEGDKENKKVAERELPSVFS